jgi:hypothetical protein
MHPALFLLLLEGDGDVTISDGKLCIARVTVTPALLGKGFATPALHANVSTQPALLAEVEVNQCNQ